MRARSAYLSERRYVAKKPQPKSQLKNPSPTIPAQRKTPAVARRGPSSVSDRLDVHSTAQFGGNVELRHVEGSSTDRAPLGHALHEGALELLHLVLGAHSDADVGRQRGPGAADCNLLLH